MADLNFGELAKRKGLAKFVIARAEDDPRGKVRRLLIHGGEFSLKPGGSVKLKFSLPAEIPTLRQLQEDGYELSEALAEEPRGIEVKDPKAGSGLGVQAGAGIQADGSAPAPVELADAFTNEAEIARGEA